MRPSKYGVLSEKAVEELVESVLRGSGESESYEGPARTRNRGDIAGYSIRWIVTLADGGGCRCSVCIVQLVAFSLEP